MPALLVSVRDPHEARLCLAAAVDLLDVKDPDAGSLGRASPAALRAVLDAVSGAVPVSAALGELADWPEPALPPEVDRLAFVKWGLASCPPDWRRRTALFRALVEPRSACRVVFAAYADFRRAAAPPPDEVCHEAVRTRAGVLLLDTWRKDGTRLSDWLPPAALGRIIRTCHDAGVRVALAGSLGRRDVAALAPLEPDWFAVRGAACAGGQRDGPLDPAAVAGLIDLLRPATPAG